jgi:hypothetical protein
VSLQTGWNVDWRHLGGRIEASPEMEAAVLPAFTGQAIIPCFLSMLCATLFGS